MQRDVKRVHKSQWFGPSLDPSHYGKTRKTAGGAQCAPPLVIGLPELHIIVRTTGIYIFIISHEVIECLWNILLHLTVWLFRHCRNALDPLLDWLSYPLTTMATWLWSWFIINVLPCIHIRTVVAAPGIARTDHSHCCESPIILQLQSSSRVSVSVFPSHGT